MASTEQLISPTEGPVTDSGRIESIDELRGFALLGILVMNIQGFSMIGAAYLNPAAYGVDGVPPEKAVGLKYTMRVYVMVTSIDPLRLYMYDDGFVHICTEPFVEGTAHMGNKAMHITNPDVQELVGLPQYKKDPRPWYWNYQTLFAYWKEQGKEDDLKLLWSRMGDMFVKLWGGERKAFQSFRTDNGGEFQGAFDEHLRAYGIYHDWAFADRPATNSRVEGLNRRIIEATAAALAQANATLDSRKTAAWPPASRMTGS